MSACMQTTRAASQRVHNKLCYYSLSIIYVAHIWALLSHTCCSYIDSILITDEGRCRDKLNPKRDTVRLTSSRCLAVRSNKSCKWFLITAIKGKQVSKLTSSPKPAVIRLSSSRCEESMWPQAVRFVSDEADAQMKWIAKKKGKQADVRLFSSRFEAANGKKQAMQTMGSKGYLPSKGLRARNQKKKCKSQTGCRKTVKLFKREIWCQDNKFPKTRRGSREAFQLSIWGSHWQQAMHMIVQLSSFLMYWGREQ